MAHFRKPIWDTVHNTVSHELAGDFPNVIGYRRNESFDPARWLHEDTINWGNHGERGGGRSVMLAALRIAYLLGFRKVNLVGCDFHMDANHRYWFDEQRSEQAIKNNQNSYRQLTKFFEQLQPRFLEAGFEVLNCTPGSRLKVFPAKDLQEAVEEASVDVSASTYGMYVERNKPDRAKQPGVAQHATGKAPEDKQS